jgi:hypothetical protein
MNDWKPILLNRMGCSRCIAPTTHPGRDAGLQQRFRRDARRPSPEGFGRNYVGYWETRNLRMVANMRDILGQHPGTRMLTIVGASHKGYYEAYLNLMHDVQLVSSDEVLR